MSEQGRGPKVRFRKDFWRVLGKDADRRADIPRRYRRRFRGCCSQALTANCYSAQAGMDFR
jgi:hypothetical protein